jgi:hypothetical protein
VIRGWLGTIRFSPKGFEIFDDNPRKDRESGSARRPANRTGRMVAIEKPRNETGRCGPTSSSVCAAIADVEHTGACGAARLPWRWAC